MIYYGMTPNPALSAKMAMTGFELRSMKRIDRPKNERVKKLRKPVGKGYTLDKKDDGRNTYKAQILVDGIVYPLGRHDTEEDARAAYLEAIDQINHGDFMKWRSRRFHTEPYKKHKESYK